jgi:hypothetical protein
MRPLAMPLSASAAAPSPGPRCGGDPLASRRLKKYRGATGQSPKSARQKTATPPLRHSEPLRVESAPLDQVAPDGHAFVAPPVRRDWRAAREDPPCRCTTAAKSRPSLLVKAPRTFSHSAHRRPQCLRAHCTMRIAMKKRELRSPSNPLRLPAGTSPDRATEDQHVDVAQRRDLLLGDQRYVAEVGHMGDGAPAAARERVDLGHAHAGPAERLPCEDAASMPEKRLRKRMSGCAHAVTIIRRRR